jgi:succinyl-CoA synthetase beta subunit
MAIMDLLATQGSTPANFMDLGGQIYHEKLTHSIILMENLDYVGAVLAVMWCG